MFLKQNTKIRDEIDKKVRDLVKVKHDIPLQIGMVKEESPVSQEPLE